MKYTKEITAKLEEDYLAGVTTADLSAELGVPVRSIIAKLSSMGVYKKKQYLTKRGEIPIKKEEYIEKLAILLGVHQETLESLEKVNKSVLALLESKLLVAKLQQDALDDEAEAAGPINYFSK